MIVGAKEEGELGPNRREGRGQGVRVGAEERGELKPRRRGSRS